MDCKQFRKSVDDFDTLSDELAGHVQSCLDCARWLGEMRMIAATIATSLRESPAPAFASRVRVRIDARRLSARAVLGLRWTEALAACLVLCAIGFGAYYFDFLGIISSTMESAMAALPDSSRWLDRVPAVPTVGVDLSWLHAWSSINASILRWLAVVMLVGSIALHEAINRRSHNKSRGSNSWRNT